METSLLITVICVFLFRKILREYFATVSLIRGIAVLAALFIAGSTAWAKTGPEIPIPKPSIELAIKIARGRVLECFNESARRDMDFDRWIITEVMLATENATHNRTRSYFWKITFTWGTMTEWKIYIFVYPDGAAKALPTGDSSLGFYLLPMYQNQNTGKLVAIPQ